jgi:hypothetical protein
MSLSGPGAPVNPNRQTAKVAAGLATRGDDELVVVLIIEPPGYLGPVTVAITDEQARQLRAQLAAALVEKPPGPRGAAGLAEVRDARQHTERDSPA